ncbi:MAG: hypothetical protein HZR80_13355 [Candidatus Heimdallarchaeota archaeon]
MAIATSHPNKKISTNISENLKFFNYKNELFKGLTLQDINLVDKPTHEVLILEIDLVELDRFDYEILNNYLYKEEIEREIINNPSHLIDVKKIQTITLKEAIKELDESYELYKQEQDEYRTRKASDLLELHLEEEKSE